MISHNININRLVEIDDDKLFLFGELLKDLSQLILNDITSKYFNLIFIISDGSIEETVNTIINDIINVNNSYKIGDNEPTGIALPIEKDNKFVPIVIFVKSLIESISINQRKKKKLFQQF